MRSRLPPRAITTTTASCWAPGSRERINYGASGTTLTTLPDGSQVATIGGVTIPLRNRDFNTLYVVWQQDREGSEVLGTRVGINDAFRSVTAPGSNIFLIKTSFWIPIG